VLHAHPNRACNCAIGHTYSSCIILDTAPTYILSGKKKRCRRCRCFFRLLVSSLTLLYPFRKGRRTFHASVFLPVACVILVIRPRCFPSGSGKGRFTRRCCFRLLGESLTLRQHIPFQEREKNVYIVGVSSGFLENP
jgi:hypothetical protein